MIDLIISILKTVNHPFWISLVCWGFIVAYYVLSAKFIRAARTPQCTGAWKKNGAVDVITSFLWCVTTVLLVVSLLDLMVRNQLTLGYLLQYYVFFIFLFAFIYNILEWHWAGMLSDAGTGWNAELKCIVVSIQTMTTLGYTTTKPGKAATEMVACIQVFLGIFFVAVFIAKAVTRL